MSSGAGPSGGTSTKEAPFMTFPPVVYLVLGVILAIAWLAANSMQIQTNEAWILGQSVAVLHPDLLIWRQLGNVASGNMTTTTSIAYIYGWGVQLILITVKIGVKRAQVYIHRKYGTGGTETTYKEASSRGSIWAIVSWFIVILDSVADWQYAAQLGQVQQIAFTALTFMCTFFLGTLALHLIFAGVSDMKGK